MKQKDVFKKIGGIIQELSDQYEYLKTGKEDLNDLELELFAANAHFLADHIEILYKLNLQKQDERKSPETKPEPGPEPQPEVKPPKAEKPEKIEKPEKRETSYEQKYFEPVVRQMKHAEDEPKKPEKELFKPIEFEITEAAEEESPVPSIDIASAAPSDDYDYTRQEPETIRHELVLDESMIFDDDEKPESEAHDIEIPEVELEPSRVSKRKKAEAPVDEEEPVAEASPVHEEEPVAVNQADPEPAEERVLTINQMMSRDKGTSRTEQLSIKPISDIKLAITLNDKLLYVKDLFNGYNLAYSEAVEILNRFNTFEEASRFLKTNYVTKNNWDSKPATVEKFYALLKRRYA